MRESPLLIRWSIGPLGSTESLESELMANQGHDRREVLEMLALAAMASQFSGFSKWICAAQHATDHATNAGAQVRPANYHPQFFTPDEYVIVDQLTETIIPKDESPGAREAGVSEFIDFMAANDPTLQQPMRDGLRWLNRQAYKEKGTQFIKLSAEQQEHLLRSLAYRNRYLPGQEAGQQFFALIRRYTVMGYYTSRIGLEELEFPGLRMYTHSPACPHKDDPEHRHLPAPRD
jgi:gluconate 2-dehydrogenase gamma chain